MDEVKQDTQGPASKMFTDLLLRNVPITTTVITKAELLRGAFYMGRKDEIKNVKLILSQFNILPFLSSTAGIAAMIMADLHRTGNMIGIADIFIASIVAENQESLVTRNVKHFSRVDGLPVETY